MSKTTKAPKVDKTAKASAPKAAAVTAPADTPATGEPTLSPEGFDMLRAAMNIARNYQVQKVAQLRIKLLDMFPGKDDLVQEALTYWGHYERTKMAAAYSR